MHVDTNALISLLTDRNKGGQNTFDKDFKKLA